MSENDSGASEKLAFLLIGAGIGATLALLFAPKSGRELRGDIADATRRGIDAAGDGVKRAGEAAGDLYETGRSRAGEYYEAGRSRAGEIYGTAREKVAQSADVVSDLAARQKEQIAAAIEAGKQAYQEEKRRSGEPLRAAAEGDGV
ncbi:MAG TPA: YtxH domain-containing protein [Blastocatellia bacterium]|jgi:gas vesicle protein|nr:YtxH domain-containing protein [Blastocatellia bacterium]